jgi:FlaA1/EpsC-like NDP-sugar epimerase
MMKKFTIEDLLNRTSIEINSNEAYLYLKNKVILISGAAGSIGSEISRQVSFFGPKEVVLFDHNENNIFFLERELKKSFPEVKFTPKLGSINDEICVKNIFDEVKPNVIYHAAANKHVPLSEANVAEAIRTNVTGTRVMANAAIAFKSEKFIMISTDKAVNPTSIMGATKRVAEYYIQLMSNKFTETSFNIVRFGNVLGSSGSVVPIFESQILNGGPVMVTHPEMTRFFMTIPEASKLVIQASVFNQSGKIFVLDMGEQIKIVDLAKRMIELSGFTPGVDMKILFSGIRPGEKISEELFFDNEKSTQTSHQKIFSIEVQPIDESYLNKINTLEIRAKYDNAESIPFLRQELSRLIPGSKLA